MTSRQCLACEPPPLAWESLSGPMRYVGVALLLRAETGQEVRLALLVPRIGPSRDPQAGSGDSYDRLAKDSFAKICETNHLLNAVELSFGPLIRT